jgi:hypothetical protein
MKMGPAEPGTEPGGKEETRGAAAELAYALASQAPRGGGGKAAKMGLSERTVEGAASPEDQAANRELVQETRAAGEATLTRLASIEEQKKAYYEDAQANAADAALEAHARQLRAQDQAATVQAAWDKTHASLQREQDAVANQKVDPNRLFSGRAGTGAAIASTISVALGAFGASLTGGPNYALQIVNSAIQRDVDAQMDSLQRRGANADNAMSNFMRAHGLEPQEAKLAVTAYGQQYAAKLAETQATQIKSLESQQAAEQFAAEMRAKAAANLADLQSKVMAKATEKYKLQGGGGGPAAAKQQLENLKLAAEVDALETKTSGSKKSSPEGEVTPRLATSEAATTAAGPGLAHLKRLSDNASSIGQVLDYFGIGGKSALTSAAENQAYLDARAETGGNVPPEHRVEQIRKNLSSPVKATRDAQIEELYAAKAALHNSNVDVSKRTAKVGAIGGSEGPVDSSGAY